MKVSDLVAALLRYDTLSARQWVADAKRASFDWSTVERLPALSETELALAAGVVELLAHRAGQSPPAWTRDVAEAPERVFLVKAAESMRRLRALCESEGPEPLRVRRFLAPPDFLQIA